MKCRALLGHLQEHGCILFREGSSHSFWSNPKTSRKEAIPRHNEIKKFLAHWTWPLWMYVSVTGVVIYWMLYRMSW